MSQEKQKALFLYHEDSGKRKREAQLSFIKDRLSSIFELDCISPKDKEEARDAAKKACGVYYALIVMGGDGTFQNIVSALANEEDAPILGYINGGTMGDVGRSFGITRSTKKAISIIEKGCITPFDIMKIGDSYCCYMAAVGAFSDIAYITQREKKARFGKMAYYLKATQEAFEKKTIEGTITTSKGSFDFKTPFLLLLSGKKVGGFLVNPKGDFSDGKIEVFLSDPGLFNGLPHYLFKDSKLNRFVTDSLKVSLKEELPWCLDGEVGPNGSLEIQVLPRHLRIFCDEKAIKKE